MHLRIRLHVFWICLIVDMVHPDNFLKIIVYVDVKLDEMEDDVKPGDVKDNIKLVDVEVDVKSIVSKVDVRAQFTSKHDLLSTKMCFNGSTQRQSNLGLVF